MQQKPIPESLVAAERDAISRCLDVIRAHGQQLQHALTAETVDEAALIASLEEIERQTSRINQILIDA